MALVTGNTRLRHSPERNNGFPLLTRGKDTTNEANQSVARDINSDQQDQVQSAFGQMNGLSPYAKKYIISQYIPLVDPDLREPTLRVRMSKRKTMLFIQLCLATSIVTMNIGLTSWAIRTYPPDSQGVGLLFFGSCSKTSHINKLVHVTLNVCSSLFLGAGNYCMQILVAPSREEVNRAHGKGKSLEIGIPSFKNLRHIKFQRVLIWLLIGMLSMILHLLWNSAIFTSRPFVSYPRAIATSDFLIMEDKWAISYPYPYTGTLDPYQNITSAYALKEMANNFTRLDKKSCIEHYIEPLSATQALVIVARNVTFSQNKGSSLVEASLTDELEQPQFWICANEMDRTMVRWCSPEWANTLVDHWVISRPDDPYQRPKVLVDYCLVGEQGNNNEKCGVHYSVHISVAVCICTFLEGVLIFWTWRRHHNKTMVTLGDAIASFLEVPASQTPEPSLRNIGENPEIGLVTVGAAIWHCKHRVTWFQAVSKWVWSISLTFFVIGMAIPAVSITSSIRYLKNRGIDMSPSGIWHQGFGLHPAALGPQLRISNKMIPELIGNILLANVGQLALSFFYVLYNAILTRQLVANEWTRYLRPKKGKKALRVSSPIGMQRSSYMLSMPLVYAVPLMLAAITLHWLVSQSIFLVDFIAFAPGPGTSRLPNYNKFTRGYSPLAVIFSITLGALLMVALLVHAAVRSYPCVPSSFPAMGVSSAAISMTCERPTDDEDARLFPLSLGIIKDMNSDSVGVLGRLTFSTFTELQPPEDGGKYLQPVIKP